MSELIAIRHGQASIFKDDYDQLSPKGMKQSELLGAYMGQKKLEFDRVIVGPLKRHRQTYDHFMSQYSNYVDVHKDIEIMDEFAEHEVDQVVRTAAKLGFGLTEEQKKLVDGSGISETEKIKYYFRYFEKISLQWTYGPLEFEDGRFESFSNFEERIDKGLNTIMETTPPGKRVALFTSGGVVGALAAKSLTLDKSWKMKLNWKVRNSSYSEFVFQKNRFGMKSFNSLSHIMNKDLDTGV